jgi:hypothetical protein
MLVTPTVVDAGAIAPLSETAAEPIYRQVP